jgi:GDP-mannose 6-dehydrogenase
MNVSIFGLGYVGCVSIGCLSKSGHNITGVDVNENKVKLINSGRPTIIEKDIDTLISRSHSEGRIRATSDYKKAVLGSDVSMICVGTPSTKEGHLNLDYIFKVAEEIGEGIKEKSGFHVVVIRSTVLPGTNAKVSKLIGEKSGKQPEKDFTVVSNPEFLREGSAVSDFYNPSVTVIGSRNMKAIEILKELYKDVDAPVEVTEIEVAEIIKYINNSFHALKITFANEAGNICRKLGIDSHKVMDLFCMDDKLNISSAYFKPGFAYGGSCLPKDLKGLKTLAHDSYLRTPVVDSIEESNEVQKKMVFDMIVSKEKKNIGILGLSFKAGTDDLRYSPSVELTEQLLGKGFNVKIFDRNVSLSGLTGTNKEYIDRHIPHLSKLLLPEIEDLIEQSDLIVVTQKNNRLQDFRNKLDGKVIIDLVKLDWETYPDNYEGISW